MCRQILEIGHVSALCILKIRTHLDRVREVLRRSVSVVSFAAEPLDQALARDPRQLADHLIEGGVHEVVVDRRGKELPSCKLTTVKRACGASAEGGWAICGGVLPHLRPGGC